MRKLVYAGLILSFSFLLIAAGCQVTQQPPRPSLSQTETVAYASTFTNLIMQVDASVVSWARTKKVTGLSSTGLKGAALLRAKETETETGPDALGYMHVTDEADNFLGHYISNYYYKKVKDVKDNVTDYFLYGIVKITSTSIISSTGGSTSTYTLMLGKGVTNPPQTPDIMPLNDPDKAQIQFHATYYTDQTGSNPFPPNGAANTLATMAMSGAVSLTITEHGGTPTATASGDTLLVELTTELNNLETPEFGAPQNGKLNIDVKVNGTDYAPIEVTLTNGIYSVKVLGISFPLNISSDWFYAAEWPAYISGTVSDVAGNWGNNGGTLRIYAVPKIHYISTIPQFDNMQPPPWNPPFSLTTYENVITQFPVLGYKNVEPGQHSSKFRFWTYSVFENPFPGSGGYYLEPGDYYIFARFFKGVQNHGTIPLPDDLVVAGEYADGNYPRTTGPSDPPCNAIPIPLDSGYTRDDINFNTNKSYNMPPTLITYEGTVTQNPAVPWPVTRPYFLYVWAYKNNNYTLPITTVGAMRITLLAGATSANFKLIIQKPNVPAGFYLGAFLSSNSNLPPTSPPPSLQPVGFYSSGGLIDTAEKINYEPTPGQRFNWSLNQYQP